MEAEQNPHNRFLSELSAPARRALEREGLITLELIAACTRQELLSLHGMGPKAFEIIRGHMDEAGLTFRG
jgi:hypothetical protein